MEANEPPRFEAADTATIAEEAVTIGLLGPGAALEAIPLSHNPLNTITGEIHRVTWDGGAAVRKVVTPSGEGAAHWSASEEPRAWNLWRREILAYRTDLPSRLGLDAPELLGSVDLPDGGAALWLEAVEGVSGDRCTVDDLAAAARQLGCAQGRADLPDDPWLSQRYIVEYPASKPVDHGLLDDEAVWGHPLLASWGPDLRSGLARLWHERARLHELIAAVPRTVAHLDVWPNNIVRRPSGSCAFLDWSFSGDGALGEDIGNLVPDAVIDLLVPDDRLDELEAAALEAYLDGLTEAGWTGDPRLVRLGMCASAVKYHWLAPLLLERLDEPVHYAYGREADPAELYRIRGVALARLVAWHAEAEELAADLGI